MAKKKKRKRRPAPPPRPGATINQITSGHPETRAAQPAEPDTAGPPVTTTTDRRQAAVKRREATKRRQRMRTVGIVGVVVLAIIGVFAFRQIQSGRRTQAHATLAAGAGCDGVREVGGLGRDHWTAGSALPTYESSPPAGGDHSASPLPQGFHSEPFSDDMNETPSIYQAVHSLEHGYVIVWTNDLTTDERAVLEREVRADARKVIVAPYPDLGEKKMAMSAWGRLQICDDPDPEVALSFVDLFREATGPEATAP